MADRVVLGFDVGATNTRASAAVLEDGGFRAYPGFESELRTEASSRKALIDFVVSVLRAIEDTAEVAGAVFAVAGPIEGRTRARITNWTDDAVISVADLERAGLPQGRVELVNDLYAGALGLAAEIGRPTGVVEIASLREGVGSFEGGHVVFVAPGTGLGAAGLVRTAYGFVPVPCEAQHTLLPAFDPEAAKVIEFFSATPSGPPSWEDVASGVGLGRTYEALCATCGRVPSETIGGSGDVAAAALSGEDDIAVATLDLYYACVGRFAQMLALTYRPCAAVYIGGGSTVKNREFIERSRIAEHFVANRVQGRLLEATPLRLVLGDLNLAGAIAEAARLALIPQMAGAAR